MTLAEALLSLDGKSTLTADDALALRRIIYGAGQPVTREEADALFKLNADCGEASHEWRMLFVEALTDYVVHQETPAGYVDDVQAAWLIDSVKRYERVREDEVDMLIHVLEEADQVPPALSDYVLGLMKTLMLGTLRDQRALVTADVERLRRVIFASGGEGNLAVTRHEAETLFDINDAIEEGMEIAASWREFFVRAVAGSVLFASTWRPDAQAELKREAWLADTGFHPFRHLAESVSHNLGHELLEGLREIVVPNYEERQMLAQAEAADEATQAGAAHLTADEGHWLAQRIGRNGRADASEQALVAFIAEEAGRDPAYADLMAQIDAVSGKSAPAAAA